MNTDPAKTMRAVYAPVEGQCCGNCQHLLALEHDPTSYRCGRTDWTLVGPGWDPTSTACGEFILREKTNDPKKLLDYLRWLRLEGARQGELSRLTFLH